MICSAEEGNNGSCIGGGANGEQGDNGSYRFGCKNCYWAIFLLNEWLVQIVELVGYGNILLQQSDNC